MAGRASLILLLSSCFAEGTKKGLKAVLEKGEMQLRAARPKGHGAALSWLLWGDVSKNRCLLLVTQKWQAEQLAPVLLSCAGPGPTRRPLGQKV